MYSNSNHGEWLQNFFTQYWAIRIYILQVGMSFGRLNDNRISLEEF